MCANHTDKNIYIFDAFNPCSNRGYSAFLSEYPLYLFQPLLKEKS